MEKIMYALSRTDAGSADTSLLRLAAELPSLLFSCGARRLAIAINDEDVAPAAALRLGRRLPAIDAVVSLWVDSANDTCAIEQVLAASAGVVGGYLVSESEALPASSASRDGERTSGMLQLAFLCIPDDLDAETWFSIWRNEHSAIAIETQSTFIYRQNLVVRPLTPAAPPFAAIVEEAFPAAAMTSQHAFYDAVGDDEKLQKNRKKLWQSSKRFVDFASIEVVPMSEYSWEKPEHD
jgi:hypothetical protein